MKTEEKTMVVARVLVALGHLDHKSVDIRLRISVQNQRNDAVCLHNTADPGPSL